jgi:molybdenum cofactor biosynthesis enzyme MoaA
MKFKLFSIVTGSPACMARCPFCVSGEAINKENIKEPQVNWRNFEIAARIAEKGGSENVILTSRGEPTLFPKQISEYLDNLKRYNFPLIELQTNGIALASQKEKYDPLLREWYKKGLTTVAISTTHYDSEKNRQIYIPYRDKYIDLPELVKELHGIGYSVRLAIVAFDGGIDNAGELEKMISFTAANKVEQLTIRPVNYESRRMEAQEWIQKRKLKPVQLADLRDYLENEGTRILSLPSLGEVYDVRGQNVFFSYPLNKNTRDLNPDNARQIIFFPDGHIRYEWEKEGAIIL